MVLGQVWTGARLVYMRQTLASTFVVRRSMTHGVVPDVVPDVVLRERVSGDDMGDFCGNVDDAPNNAYHETPEALLRRLQGHRGWKQWNRESLQLLRR